MAHTFGQQNRIPSVASTTLTDNPVTGSFAAGTGATVMVMMLAYAGTTARGGGAPTFAGSALTQAGTQRYGATSGEASAEMWYFLSPPTSGSYAVSIPNTGALALSADIASGKAAAGYGSVLDATSGSANTGATTNPYTTITISGSGDILFGNVANGAQNWNPTATSGSILYNRDNGAWGEGSQYDLQPTAGLKTLSWTFGTGEDWGVCAVAFKEQPGNAVLSINTSTNVNACESPNLAVHNPNWVLTISNTAQATSSETPTLTYHVPAPVTLVIANGIQVTASDVVTLTGHVPTFSLTINNADNINTGEKVTLVTAGSGCPRQMVHYIRLRSK